MTPESLPVRLRQARGTMSLADAAEHSGVPADRIRKYEEGGRRPYGKTLRRLAEAYDVPVAELAGEDRGGLRSGRRESSPAQRPERRRRRRRRAAPETATKTVEVPLEVPAGEAVRVVIELVIRPKASIHEASGAVGEVPAAPEAQAARETATAPTAPRSSAPQPGSAPQGRVLAADRRASVPGRPASDPPSAPDHASRDGRTRRRRPKVPATASNGGDQHRLGTDDPLEGFRQAYREFRREKT